MALGCAVAGGHKKRCCQPRFQVAVLERHNTGCAASPRPGDLIPMILDSNTTAPELQPSPWLGFVRFLLLAILVAGIFLLARAMVNHRFFRGGWVDQRDVLKP
jgi:hypothetical protein